MSLELSNHFLIAMPQMAGPNFAETLTLICEHSDQGALGFVINRPTEVLVSELFEQQNVKISTENPLLSSALYAGGPVNTEQGFILHSPEMTWETTMRVGNDFGITASLDIIEATATGNGPEHNLFLLGYAGWAPGQLEQEITANTWLTSQADPDIVFGLPSKDRWKAAAEGLGIDLNLLTPDAGHA
jgi:putative transcriptional regulator